MKYMIKKKKMTRTPAPTTKDNDLKVDKKRKKLVWLFAGLSFLVSIIVTVIIFFIMKAKGEFSIFKLNEINKFKAFILNSIAITAGITITSIIDMLLIENKTITNAQRILFNVNIVYCSTILSFFILNLIFNFGGGMLSV